jgi:hypothetical protein
MLRVYVTFLPSSKQNMMHMLWSLMCLSFFDKQKPCVVLLTVFMMGTHLPNYTITAQKRVVFLLFPVHCPNWSGQGFLSFPTPMGLSDHYPCLLPIIWPYLHPNPALKMEAASSSETLFQLQHYMVSQTVRPQSKCCAV